MRTLIFYTWPLMAIVALVSSVTAFDPGAAGQIFRAALEVALS